MEENIIAFNFENWITVVIMVALGFAIISLVAQGVKAGRRLSPPAPGGMSNNPA